MKDLYIIHGWTYTVEPWKKTLEILKEKGIKFEMLNVPGLTSPSKKIWTIDDYVSWANKNIPDNAVALGHSNGGRILLNLCSKNPEKLRKLILLDSAGVYEKSRKRDILRKVSKLGAPLKKSKLISKVFHKLIGASDYSNAPENMKKTLSNMLDSDKNLNLEPVSTPTIILWGEKDTVTPPRQAKVLNEKLKNSKLKFYKNWTHAPYISNPPELASAIITALKEES